MTLSVVFDTTKCTVPDGSDLTVGREGALTIENPYLHRAFLSIGHGQVRNCGSRLGCWVAAPGGVALTRLLPGQSVPLVFPAAQLVFSAGPILYRIAVDNDAAPFAVNPPERLESWIVAMSENSAALHDLLRAIATELHVGDTVPYALALPTSAVLAQKLGWTPEGLHRVMSSAIATLGIQTPPDISTGAMRALLCEYVAARCIPVAGASRVAVDSSIAIPTFDGATTSTSSPTAVISAVTPPIS